MMTSSCAHVCMRVCVCVIACYITVIADFPVFHANRYKLLIRLNMLISSGRFQLHFLFDFHQ